MSIGLGHSKEWLTARQKSAEDIVGMSSRFTRLRHSPERGETVGLAEPGTSCRRSERLKGKVSKGRCL